MLNRKQRRKAAAQAKAREIAANNRAWIKVERSYSVTVGKCRGRTVHMLEKDRRN